MRMGNQQINTNPCTEAEEKQNWAIVQNFVANFTALAAADHTVAINAADEAAVHAGYLHVKIDQTEAMPVGSYVPVGSFTVSGDATERWFWNAADVTGWVDTGFRVFAIEDGEPVFTEISVDVDDKRTKVTSTDSVTGFFHDCIQDTDTIVGNADLIVVGNVVGADATDQHERFAVDVSAITGHSDTLFLLLGIEANVSTYFTITVVGEELVADATFITNLEAILDARYKGNIRKGRVTVAIPAATGPLTAQWGTTGKVKLQHATTGVVSAVETAVDNDNIGSGWVVDCQAIVDMDYSPPRVLGGSCRAVSWT